MAILSFLVKFIGWPGILLLCFYVYEEGVPGASRIPILSSIPIIGDLTTGRVHVYAADQVKIATATQKAICDGKLEKTVSTFQYDALAAQLAKEQQDRLHAEQMTTEASKRTDAALRASSEAKQELEARIAADTDPNGGRWTEEDEKWSGKH